MKTINCKNGYIFTTNDIVKYTTFIKFLPLTQNGKIYTSEYYVYISDKYINSIN